MGKKLLSVTVHGTHKTWSFTFEHDPKYLEEWRADGLEIDELLNTIPRWVARLGLVRQWCFCQDLFNFKWPW